jgi:hypothetical protein
MTLFFGTTTWLISSHTISGSNDTPYFSFLFGTTTWRIFRHTISRRNVGDGCQGVRLPSDNFPFGRVIAPLHKIRVHFIWILVGGFHYLEIFLRYFISWLPCRVWIHRDFFFVVLCMKLHIISLWSNLMIFYDNYAIHTIFQITSWVLKTLEIVPLSFWKWVHRNMHPFISLTKTQMGFIRRYRSSQEVWLNLYSFCCFIDGIGTT